MTCIPAGNKSINAKVGLLTCLVVAPSRSCGSVAKSASNIHPARVAVTDATYSNWYCSRFSLDSLFTDCGVLTTFSSLCIANIRIISIRCASIGIFLLLAPQKTQKAAPENPSAALYYSICNQWLKLLHTYPDNYHIIKIRPTPVWDRAL